MKHGINEDSQPKCEHCSKNCINGFDLTCIQDHKDKDPVLMHFCSIHCLSRWVGEKGWLYELYIRGKHKKANLPKTVHNPQKLVSMMSQSSSPNILRK
jgi:hypothetical protein